MPASPRAAAGGADPLADIDEEAIEALPLTSHRDHERPSHRPGPVHKHDAAAFPWRKVARVLFLIALWYSLSTALTLYNKIIVSGEHGFVPEKFPCPLLMTGTQFMMQAVISRSVLLALGRAQEITNMSWKNYWHGVVPNGVSTGMDIGLSNMSLAFITTSFYTMCKSTAPVFLLMFAFVFRLERPSWSLGGIVAVIFLGLFFLVYGETRFDLFGFVLVMLASALSGFRWTITQMLLQGGEGAAHGAGLHRMGAVTVLSVLTPVMGAVVLFVSLVYEQVWNALPGTPFFASPAAIAMSLFVVFVGANVAFLMVVVEFRVIQETSALTLMVAGSFKEIVTVLAAVLLFHDTFTAVNGMGLFILLVGVSLFNLHKYYRFRQHGKGGGPGGHADAAGRPEEHRRTGGAEQEMHAMHAAQAAGARTNGGGGQEPTWRTSAD